MLKMSTYRPNALLIVVCGKHFYNVNKDVGYDMTSTMTHLLSKQRYKLKF